MNGEKIPKAQEGKIASSDPTKSVVQSNSGDNRPVASEVDIERVFAEVLAETLNLEQVDPDKHFFDDLGADSVGETDRLSRVS